MLEIEGKVNKIIEATDNMKRADIISHLRKYRGRELAEIAAHLGYECSKGASKTVALQLVLQHLLSYKKNRVRIG